jgi:hypothetical protein
MVKYRRLRKKINGLLSSEPLIRWLAWFNKNSPPELVTEVKKMDEAIQLADERLVYLSGDEDAIRAYEVRFKAMCDWTSERNYAIKTGRDEKALEIARKMKEAGRPFGEIIEFTDIPAETIEQL